MPKREYPINSKGKATIRTMWTDDNFRLHREDGPAVEDGDGSYKEWYIHDRLHREDGPAIEYVNGYKEWWVNNKLHREDGPAVEWPNCVKYWYSNGVKLNCKTQEEFEQLMKLELFW